MKNIPDIVIDGDKIGFGKTVGNTKYESPEQLYDKAMEWLRSITVSVPRFREVVKGGRTVLEAVENNNHDQVIDTEWTEEPQLIKLYVYLGIDASTWKRYRKKGGDWSKVTAEIDSIIKARKLDLLTISKNPRGVMFQLSAEYAMHEKQQVEHTLNVEQYTDDQLEDRITELLAMVGDEDE